VAASGFSFREAGVADADAIARVVADAFAGYRSFAPAGWEPPTAEDEIGHGVAPLLVDPDAWCVVAERDGGVVAHSAFQPARTSVEPIDQEGLAHLRALFVDRQWWGCGLAAKLHSMALEEAARRGFTAIRLFTPAGQARARRFYEREGWQPTGEPVDSPFGLAVVEYRRPLA
jgi:GNAT superfamily N-acetyltransferase